jgi:hypothetical protein
VASGKALMLEQTRKKFCGLTLLPFFAVFLCCLTRSRKTSIGAAHLAPVPFWVARYVRGFKILSDDRRRGGACVR